MENLKGINYEKLHTGNPISANAFISIMMRENYCHKKRYLNENLKSI